MAEPRLVQYAANTPPKCCKYELPKQKKNDKPKFVDGIRVFLQISFRGNPGAPIRLVTISSVGGERAKLPLTKEEQKQSEDGSVTLECDLCISCRGLLDRVAHFEVHAFDTKQGSSMDKIGIVLGEDQFTHCCGNLPKPPVKPVPVHGD